MVRFSSAVVDKTLSYPNTAIIAHPSHFQKLRIISGTARGRKLTAPPEKDTSIRPTADRAREALFNILGQRVKNSQVLDLFAGTGALGLEVISRGGRQLVLVDNGHLSLRIIKKNVSIFPARYLLNKSIVIIKDDLQKPSFLKKLPENITPQFDIIFADPPYDRDLSLPVLQFINDNNVLNPHGVLVIEERHDIILPAKLSNLECMDQRTYGETRFTFYKTYKNVIE